MLDQNTIAQKAECEQLLQVWAKNLLVGCVIHRNRPGSVYLGTLTIEPGYQGRGIVRQLVAAFERTVFEALRNVIELDTRIQLTENHAVFYPLGFEKISEHAYAGYDQPTFITMQKRLITNNTDQSTSQC